MNFEQYSRQPTIHWHITYAIRYFITLAHYHQFVGLTGPCFHQSLSYSSSEQIKSLAKELYCKQSWRTDFYDDAQKLTWQNTAHNCVRDTAASKRQMCKNWHNGKNWGSHGCEY